VSCRRGVYAIRFMSTTAMWLHGTNWRPRMFSTHLAARGIRLEVFLKRRKGAMHGIIYIVGLIVVLMFLLSFLGLR
jgi:hypothetical protein